MTLARRQLQKVKPVSRNDNHQAVRSLRSFKEVHQKIVEGWAIAEIARFIHEVRNEAGTTPREVLVAQLSAYRKSLPAAVLTQRITPLHKKAVQKVEEGLDELTELEKLYKLQMDRIAIDTTNEKNIKKLLPSTGYEVKVAKDILSTYAELKMDLGLSKRHLGQMDVDAHIRTELAIQYQKPEVQSVLSDAQSRHKVLSIAERLLSKSTLGVAGGLAPLAPSAVETMLRTDETAAVLVDAEMGPSTPPAPQPNPEGEDIEIEEDLDDESDEAEDSEDDEVAEESEELEDDLLDEDAHDEDEAVDDPFDLGDFK